MPSTVLGNTFNDREQVEFIKRKMTMVERWENYTKFEWLKGFLRGSVVKNPPARQEKQLRSLGQKDPLQKEMAIHSSISA